MDKELTKQFIELFDDETVYGRAFGRMVASGILPSGVSAEDSRVRAIIQRCADWTK